MNPADCQSALSEVTAALKGAGPIAIDTEADSLHCYQEKLCLIQISVAASNYLVDPLAQVSMEPLYQELRTHPLVLHGADYDLRLFRRAGFVPSITVFDTMLAARLVGLRQFSLAALVQEFFGVVLSKGSQKANWGRRPLTPIMIEYAMNDTRFLLELSERLGARLVELGRKSWFLQSCERLMESTRSDGSGKDGREPWQISGSGRLRSRAAAILRELWTWRDAEAARIDRPPFHVMHNEDLIKWSETLDLSGEADPPHLRGGRRARFFEAAQRALATPQETWPVIPRGIRTRRTPEQERRIKHLREHRDRVAHQLGLDSSVIASRGTIEAIASDPSAAENLMPWQRELMGLINDLP